MKPIPSEAWHPVDFRDQCLQVGCQTRVPAEISLDRGMRLEQDKQFERAIGLYLWRQGLVKVWENFDIETQEHVRSCSLWVLKR